AAQRLRQGLAQRLLPHRPAHRRGRQPDHRAARMTMNVGFVGLGTMGLAMAANARRAGFDVSAWNRTPGRAGDLEELGVKILDSPAAVAAASDIVITMVSDTPDVDAVLFGEQGVAAGATAGTLVVDMSTISPSATRDFAARLASQQ